MTTYKKKLIEVALPLEAINKASAREKSIRHGHPSTLHLWWARRPLAAARAVIFAQMVDDPSSYPDLFPTEKEQEKERKRLFKIIEDLVQWENTNNEAVLQAARDKIWESWRRTCAENADHPRAKELFDRDKLPAFHDPFAGGGSLPLEAQRLGLEAYASDLNPVAVLINKALIEIPPKFAGVPPVNPKSRVEGALRVWRGAEGLAEDVRYYGQWMRDEAERRIGHLYPKVKVTEEMAKNRPDLEPYVGHELKVIAWLWARTVKSPNPAFADVDVPLTSTFVLSSKPGSEAYVQPIVDGATYRFEVRTGSFQRSTALHGTKSGGSGTSFRCLVSGVPITFEYIRSEAKCGRMGVRLLAVVAEAEGRRVYLSPTPEMEHMIRDLDPVDAPDTDLPVRALGFRIQEYGMTKWKDLFSPRQLLTMMTFSDLVQKVREKVIADGQNVMTGGDAKGLLEGGLGLSAYADAIAVYCALAVDKIADYNSSLVVWSPTRNQAKSTFARQALPMVWDYAEVNPFAGAAGDIAVSVEGISRVLEKLPCAPSGHALQKDATIQSVTASKVVSTDPPYFDNIGYADLSDYFYVWLRRSLKETLQGLFATVTVPKADELVATPYRHGSKEKAETFFLTGMTRALQQVAELAHESFPVTIYYAFKQAESRGDEGVGSTGWETFLSAVIQAGFAVTGTWPVRTERKNRSVGLGTNALASSIVLVCRKRSGSSRIGTRREFLVALKDELPRALAYLQRANIAPVDLAQAAIGPGMAVYSRYAKVVDAAGNPLSVGEALSLINQVLDEVLAEQEGEFDSDTRWALAWFEQYAFTEGEYGDADTLSKAKNTSVEGMVQAGIVESKRGKVRLLRPSELPANWDPSSDKRLTAWEIVHHLVRALEQGEEKAADLVRELGSRAEVARDLAYRLYSICERKKRASEALSYNSLVQSWPEIVRLAQEGGAVKPTQSTIFDLDGEEVE